MANDNPFNISTQLELHLLQVAVQKMMMDYEMVQAVDLEMYQDKVMHSLVYRLRTEVLAEKVLTDTKEIPWSGTVTRQVPPSDDLRWRWLPLYVVAPALCFAGTLMANLGTVIAGLVVCACALAVTLKNPPHKGYKESLPVSGTVTVEATYWRKFPNATIQYPKELGSPVRHAITQASWKQNEPPS